MLRRANGKEAGNEQKADKRIAVSSLVCLVASSCAMFILATYIPSAAGKANSRFTLTTEFGNTFFVAVVAS